MNRLVLHDEHGIFADFRARHRPTTIRTESFSKKEHHHGWKFVQRSHHCRQAQDRGDTGRNAEYGVEGLSRVDGALAAIAAMGSSANLEIE
jgi:hypothetical protein